MRRERAPPPFAETGQERRVSYHPGRCCPRSAPWSPGHVTVASIPQRHLNAPKEYLDDLFLRHNNFRFKCSFHSQARARYPADRTRWIDARPSQNCDNGFLPGRCNFLSLWAWPPVDFPGCRFPNCTPPGPASRPPGNDPAVAANSAFPP